ncbi:MAG: PQQ-like beta-propeller repeat protein [Ignavibacteriaceae bacterium]|nr:PQQ-like beta-propeller repeat protein [Ignavibacteriaceae bacterium]
MKHFIKLLLLTSPILFPSFECSDNITNPTEYPEGYQFDIPWPSLADSPWPMYRGNPQSTGRSRESLNIQGIVEWEYVNQGGQLNSSIVIDKDSNIYVPFHYGSSWGGTHILGKNGKLKKILDSNYFCGTTPIIAADGSFYNWSQNHGITCYNPDKTVRWFYSVNSTARTSNLNIGLDGIIYFLDNHTLFALGKDGVLKWSLQDDRFSSWPYALTTFSPDGETLYVPGEFNKAAIYAVDISTKTIKWSFGQGNSEWSVVDSYGNIYVSTSIDSINSGQIGLFSLNTDGAIRWFNENRPTKQITLDRYGNIFFIGDSLYSLDYSGKLRWSKEYIPVDAPLTSDNWGNVYLVYVLAIDEFHLMKISNEGNINFDITLNKDSGDSPALGNNRIYLPSGKRDIIYSIK